MSWIFTIVFSGMLFSASQTPNIGQSSPAVLELRDTTIVRLDETDRFEQTYPLAANGRVSVSNVNGSITAEAWDRNEVKFIAIKTADSKDRLSDAQIKIDSTADSFDVETKYDNWRKDNGGWRNNGKLVVDYQLMIPRGAILNDIDTVNGSVTVSNFTNVTKVSAVNGTIKASNLRGTADLSTVNGEVFADFGSLDAGSKIALQTVNGKVNLTIPSDANATVKADSVNGNIINDFGLPVRKGKYVGRDMYGRIGNGDVRIKLGSVNGELKVSRQNDGKPVSPTTNLLTQKGKDDDEWDADVDAEAGARKQEAIISRKDREQIRVDTTRAMKDAQREIARIEPQIRIAAADSVRQVATESVRQAAEVMKSEQVQNAIRAGIQQSAVLAKMADISFFPSMPRVERKANSFAVNGVPNVKIDSRGCDVRVTGWDKPEVKYSVTQMSSARDNSPIDVQESNDASGVTLKIKADNDLRRTRVEIFVPRKSNLIIKTDSEIRLDGISGQVDLTGTDGAINVRDGDGKLTIASTDGRIRVIGFKGELETTNVDGMTSLEGDFSKLSAKADSGEIILTLPEDAAATIRSRSPETRVEGLAARLISENDERREYKLGSGKAVIDLATDGEVLVRSSVALGDIL